MATTNTNKNYYGRRKGRRKKDTKLARIARKVAQQEIAKNEQTEVEKKFWDKEVASATSISSSGFVTHLTNVAPGDDYNDRIGIMIKAVSLQFRMLLTVADTTNIVRIIIFRWFRATTPTTALVLEQLPTGGAISPLSMINVENRRVVQIMYDNLFPLDSDDPIKVDKAFFKKNMKISFAPDDSVDLGHIYFLAISDSVAVSHPTVHANFRLRYTDQ